MATWADTTTGLAADLLAGNEDARGDAPELLRRALATLPTAVRAAGRIRLRADAGFFAGQLARAALGAGIEFAVGTRRIAPLWRLLDGLTEADWTDAIDMAGTHLAVADYCPDWLLAASLTGWLHQLTARITPDGTLRGHGVREGQAMIATLRRRLIRVPARLIRHAGTLTLRLQPREHGGDRYRRAAQGRQCRQPFPCAGPRSSTSCSSGPWPVPAAHAPAA